MLEQFLREFLIIFAVSTAVAVVFRFARLPSLVGFIVSGVIVGPHGFGFISDTQTIQQIAELGLVFLLFSIGVEFSLKSLLQMKRVLIGGGALQFLSVTLVTLAVTQILGFSAKEGFLIGSMMALSSTAIVFKTLHERREIATPHGNLAVGILLFQDLLVVPLMLVIPLLAQSETASVTSKPWIEFAIRGIGVIGALFLGSRYLIPKLFELIARSGGREIFEVAVMNEAQYQKFFGGTALTRAKRNGLRRNALIAMTVNKHSLLKKALELCEKDRGFPIQETLCQIQAYLERAAVYSANR